MSAVPGSAGTLRALCAQHPSPAGGCWGDARTPLDPLSPQTSHARQWAKDMPGPTGKDGDVEAIRGGLKSSMRCRQVWLRARSSPVCVRAPQHREKAMPGPRPPSGSSGRGRGQSQRLAPERGAATRHREGAGTARLPMGKAPGTRPAGAAQHRPSSRAAHGEPCPRRRQRGRAGTPGAARPGHSPGPPRPERGRSPAPRGGVRCSPARNSR